MILFALIPFATSVDALVAVVAVAIVHVVLIGYETMHFARRASGFGTQGEARPPAGAG